MGTRNLTVVLLNGEHKIAQYGQWDGYPTGQGITICKFLQNGFDLEKFKTSVSECRFLSDDEVETKTAELMKGNSAPEGFVDMPTAEKIKKAFPELDRDIGAGVLKLVNDGTRELQDSLSFATDGLFCEWAYVLDLDKEKLEVHPNGFESLEKRKAWATYSFAKATEKAMHKLEARRNDE